MTDTPNPSPHTLQLPAVLQVGGQAPSFGILASIADQGLMFDFHAGMPRAPIVGSKALLDFNALGQHHAFPVLIVHVANSRALLSLRDAPPARSPPSPRRPA